MLLRLQQIADQQRENFASSVQSLHFLIISRRQTRVLSVRYDFIKGLSASNIL